MEMYEYLELAIPYVLLLVCFWYVLNRRINDMTTELEEIMDKINKLQGRSKEEKLCINEFDVDDAITRYNEEFKKAVFLKESEKKTIIAFVEGEYSEDLESIPGVGEKVKKHFEESDLGILTVSALLGYYLYNYEEGRWVEFSSDLTAKLKMPKGLQAKFFISLQLLLFRRFGKVY